MYSKSICEYECAIERGIQQCGCLQWMIQSFVTFMEIIALIMPWDQFHLMSVTVLLTVLDHILVYLSPASQWITQVIGTGYTDCTIMIIKI